MAAFVIRDMEGRVYPNPARRLAADFFFHEQIYRGDGASVFLPPGEYTVTWDGLDDKGNAVAAGDYIVHVEVSREHGTRVHMTETITCNDQKQEEKLEGNLEVSSVVIRFGPRKE